MLQMYDSLRKYIGSGNLKDKVEVKFIDVLSDEIDKYPDALELLGKGCEMPLVLINGAVKAYGGIPFKAVCKEIEKCL